MPQLGTGQFPTATELDADDRLVALVDGEVQEVPGSVAKALMLPAGLTDVDDHTALAGSLLYSCDATTGFTAISRSTLSVNTTEKTQGTGSVKWVCSLTSVAAGTPHGKCYYTFTTPQAIGTHTFVAFDVAFGTDGPVTAKPEYCVAKVADGVALTGNVQTIIIPRTDTETFQTLILPLVGLTAIKSIGLERIEATSANVDARMSVWIDNIHFPDESKLDQALGSAANVGVIVGNTYTPPANQVNPVIPDNKAVLDLQNHSFSGFNRTIWLDSYYIDPTGATDVTIRMSQVINSAPPYSVIKAPAGALYRFDGPLLITNIDHVEIDFSEATLFLTWEENKQFVSSRGCSHLKIRVGLWLGYHDVTQSGSAMVTRVGTPTNNGLLKELNALDEEVEGSSDSLGAWLMARHVNQQVGLPGTDIPKYWWKFTLHDSAQVANDCVFTVYNDDTNEVLYTTTQTLTATPTEYWFGWAPTDFHIRPMPALKKGTATANTITITNNTRYGRTAYDADYDTASGFGVFESHHIEICDGTIEGFGGDGVQGSNELVHAITVRNIISRGNRRQGMSFNRGFGYLIEDCVIENTGRSGLDLEPFGSDWLAGDISVRNLLMFNVKNYGLAMTNWANLTNLNVDTVHCTDPGLGFTIGGARGGIFKNLYHHKVRNTIIGGCGFTGVDLDISNLHLDGGLSLGDGTSDADGIDYTAASCSVRDVYFHGITTSGTRRVKAFSDVWAISNVYHQSTAEADFTTASTAAGTIGLAISDGNRFSNVDMGEWARQLPNTFKGVAHKSVWIPGGFNHLDDPLYRVHSISGTTTKGNNLGQRNVSVANGATTKAIVFPSQQPGAFNTAPTTTSWDNSGTLTPSTQYYYRIAPRTRLFGPRNWWAQLSRQTSVGHSAVLIKFVNAIDHTNDMLMEGWTILRGTVNGGPYTERCELLPNEQLWGHIGKNLEVFDRGSACVWTGTSPGDGIHGYPQSMNFTSGSWTAVDESGYEPDALYTIAVYPSWLTTWNVWNKTTAGFDIAFGTPAGATDTIDYEVKRFGS